VIEPGRRRKHRCQVHLWGHYWAVYLFISLYAFWHFLGTWWFFYESGRNYSIRWVIPPTAEIFASCASFTWTELARWKKSLLSWDIIFNDKARLLLWLGFYDTSWHKFLRWWGHFCWNTSVVELLDIQLQSFLWRHKWGSIYSHRRRNNRGNELLGFDP